MEIILASGSPRRKALMSLLYDEFRVMVSDIRELVPKDLAVDKCPEYLACMKAESVSRGREKALVIGCDTSVVIEGKILNKPRSTNDARVMMQLLSGHVHKVITGCCLYYMGRFHSFSEVTEVEFYPLSEQEIEAYIATTEPYDKAGGYGIQNKGALFIKGIRGDYYNVVGLPVARMKREIESFLSQDFTTPLPCEEQPRKTAKPSKPKQKRK